MSIYVPETKSEKPERRSGHICVHFQGKIFVWGGYNDEDADDENQYFDGTFLWIYNINTCLWRRVDCSGDVPSGRSGSCAACIGQTMYLFGGHCGFLGHCNDLFSLDQVTYEWKYLTDTVEGTPPLPRDKFGCWTFKNRIIYFGGYGPKIPYYNGPFAMHEFQRGWNGELVVLELNSDNTLEWKYPDEGSKGNSPQPRAAHEMTRIGNKGYLFGGRHSGCRDNDLHSIDLETLEWSGKLSITGREPCGRSWHIFVPCGPTHILLYGGFDSNDKELEDAWLLDVNTLTWIQTDAFNKLSVPRSRLWHAACNTSNESEVAIFGGCSMSLFGPSSDHTNDLVFFNFRPRKLERLCEDVLVEKNACYKTLSVLPRSICGTLTARLGISRPPEECDVDNL